MSSKWQPILRDARVMYERVVDSLEELEEIVEDNQNFICNERYPNDCFSNTLKKITKQSFKILDILLLSVYYKDGKEEPLCCKKKAAGIDIGTAFSTWVETPKTIPLSPLLPRDLIGAYDGVDSKSDAEKEYDWKRIFIGAYDVVDSKSDAETELLDAETSSADNAADAGRTTRRATGRALSTGEDTPMAAPLSPDQIVYGPRSLLNDYDDVESKSDAETEFSDAGTTSAETSPLAIPHYRKNSSLRPLNSLHENPAKSQTAAAKYEAASKSPSTAEAAALKSLGRSGSRSGSRRGSRNGSRRDSRSGSRSGSRTGSRSGNRSGNRTVSRIGSSSRSRSGSRCSELKEQPKPPDQQLIVQKEFTAVTTTKESKSANEPSDEPSDAKRLRRSRRTRQPTEKMSDLLGQLTRKKFTTIKAPAASEAPAAPATPATPATPAASASSAESSSLATEERRGFKPDPEKESTLRKAFDKIMAVARRVPQHDWQDDF